jgi:hypothetical protein
MASPTSRDEFKQYVLRALGYPVIEINVSDDQVEDRIDEALKYYADYHFDGTERTYYKHQITADDRTNKYITLPENILGAVRVFPVVGSASGSGMFSTQYQIALNEMYTFTSSTLLPYYMAMYRVRQIEELLVGQTLIRYNRHRNRLHLDIDWNKLAVGDYVIVEAHEVVDPSTFIDVWKDRWLARYTECLVKKQWGTNMKKFTGMKLPGGIEFNGQQIYNEAVEEQEKLEETMLRSYSLPPEDMIG